MSAWQAFLLVLGGALIGGYVGACLALRFLSRRDGK